MYITALNKCKTNWPPTNCNSKTTDHHSEGLSNLQQKGRESTIHSDWPKTAQIRVTLGETLMNELIKKLGVKVTKGWIISGSNSPTITLPWELTHTYTHTQPSHSPHTRTLAPLSISRLIGLQVIVFKQIDICYVCKCV